MGILKGGSPPVVCRAWAKMSASTTSIVVGSDALQFFPPAANLLRVYNRS